MKLAHLLTILVILTIFTGFAIFTYSLSQPKILPADHSTLSISLHTDNNQYTIDETVLLSLQLTNIRDIKILLTSMDSGISVMFNLLNEQNQSVTQWTQQKTFSQTEGDLILPAHSTYYLNTTWSQTDISGRLIGTAGTYTLHASLLLSQSTLSAQPTSFILNRRQPSDLTLSLTTNHPTYAPTDTAFITISITNNASSNLTLLYPSSQTADFTVKNADNTTVFQWSQNQTFAQVLTSITIPPNTTKLLLNTTYDLTTNAGQTLTPGSYALQAWTTTTYAYGVPPATPSAFVTPSDPALYSVPAAIELT